MNDDDREWEEVIRPVLMGYLNNAKKLLDTFDDGTEPAEYRA